MFSDDDGSLSPTRRLVVFIALLVALASGLVWYKNREENPVVSRRARTVAVITVVFAVMAGTPRIGGWESGDD